MFKKSPKPVESNAATNVAAKETVETPKPVEIPPLLQSLLDRIASFPEPKPFQYGTYIEEEGDEIQPESDDEDEEDEEAELAAERKEEEEMKEKEKERNANRPKNDRLGVGSDSMEAHRQFKVFRREVRSMRDGALNNIETELEIKEGTPLISNISSLGIAFNTEQEKLLFGRIATHYYLPLERLLAFYPVIKEYAYPSEDMKKLREWLTPEYERYKIKMDLLISKGKITYDGLWYLFQAEGKIFARSKGDMIVGAKIITRSYGTESFSIQAKSIKSNGEVYFEIQQPYSISKFRGMMDIAELRVQPMTEDMLKILHERGRMFKKITAGHHYRQYKGFLMVQKMWGMNYITADGRIMVDLKTFGRMNPNYPEFNNPLGINTLAQLAQQRSSNNSTMAKLHRDIYFMTWPTVAGFSFSCKIWGEMRVDSISKIQFDDQAYGRLVMPSDKKHLVQALVDQHNKTGRRKESTFSDLIAGKGGGCIFLLNGPPGTGKTLTAEAIAEYLHLPLYSISVGELGTNTKDLETKLQDILELASIWDSVVLMDEADIFLEKRSDNDVIRNAMVGIFLRLLEYYQGVLFLTTNRVKCFDEAFHSRVSVALKYEELDGEAREQVWNNFFEHAGFTGIDSKELAEVPLNGRQIRNVIQLSSALSAREGKQLGTEHIARTMYIATQFQDDLSPDQLAEAS